MRGLFPLVIFVYEVCEVMDDFVSITFAVVGEYHYNVRLRVEDYPSIVIPLVIIAMLVHSSNAVNFNVVVIVINKRSFKICIATSDLIRFFVIG